MWCFNTEMLDQALERFARARFIAGHSPEVIQAAVAGAQAFLHSPEAIKLRIRELEVEPAPLVDFFPIEVEIEEEIVLGSATALVAGDAA